MIYDTLVLGAGTVGVSTALALQNRGRTVALIDRREPGEEASFGNAGVVECTAFGPPAFPRDPRLLLRVMAGRVPAARLDWASVPSLLSWFLAYYRESGPQRQEHSARSLQPLLARAVAEHQAFAAQARAESFFRDGGWLKIFSSDKSRAADAADYTLAREFGYTVRELSVEEALVFEPHLQPVFRSAALWTDPWSVSSPGGVTKAYASAFEAAGGTILTADALSLTQVPEGWRVAGPAGAVTGREAVIALGAWSGELLSRFGYRLPLAAKRGYHMHYSSRGGAMLNRPVHDADTGYVITPMQRGIRLTTGVEFARIARPKHPVQVDMCEPAARRLYPLGDRLDAEAWMGCRPMMPDALPVIGAATRHKGLWLNFGHQHLGFTLGPASARLLAELMAGEVPFMDAVPFAPTRF